MQRGLEIGCEDRDSQLSSWRLAPDPPPAGWEKGIASFWRKIGFYIWAGLIRG
jgi:hypothetical protein